MRLSDARRYCSHVGVDLVEGEYEIEKWESEIGGHKNDPDELAVFDDGDSVHVVRGHQFCDPLDRVIGFGCDDPPRHNLGHCGFSQAGEDHLPLLVVRFAQNREQVHRFGEG